MRVLLIGCVAANGVIGSEGNIPWDLPEDRRRFREMTWGQGVVMGRKTYFSIGHTLPGRINFVLSRTWKSNRWGLYVCADREEVLRKAALYGARTLWVIGGSEMYATFLSVAQGMELTLLKRPYEGDRYFPDWKAEEWEVSCRVPGGRPLGDPLEHEYVTLVRREHR